MSHILTTWQTRRAFSILELAVVLGIIALIAGAGINMAAGALKAADRVSTQERLNTIKLALDSFAKTYGYLPCPADRTLTATSANFGVESRAGANCTAVAGVVLNDNVWFGALPVRTLGLPDNYAWDAWDGKLTYAASSTLITTPIAMSTQAGAIILRDGNLTASNIVSSTRNTINYTNANDGFGNASVSFASVLPANTLVHLSSNAGSSGYKGSYWVKTAANPTLLTTDAPGSTTYLAFNASDAGGTAPSAGATFTIPGAGTAYTVVSHGPDGRGAFPANGAAILTNKTCSVTAIDGENCNDDATFFDTAYNDGTQAALYFDDYIVSGSNDVMRAPVNNSLYTNASTSACPVGTCETWCAACTINYSGTGTSSAVLPTTPATFTSGMNLCRKIITSNATNCTASCFWGGVTASGIGYLKCS